jgi:hypothetical protein
MNGTRITLVALAAGALTVFPSIEANASDPKWTKNCTELNKKYSHGVGKRHAHDHTSGTPVTTFKRSNRLYRIANRANGQLDGDDDGIACEKA